ncbi:MAG TPA: hypothetical protein VLU54_08595 [Casimicrobiaceae bacterium]|nr:hypothetical protein [Casimicrobiaceae bacterium]
MRSCAAPLSIIRLAATVGAVVLAPQAWGDCKPVLSAMEKIANQPRVGMYEVDDRNSAPEIGEGTVIRVEKQRWMTMDGAKFMHGSVEFPDLSVYRSFHDFDSKGALHCENLGDTTYRGASAIAFRFNNPMMNGEIPAEVLKRWNTTPDQVRKAVMLIDKSSGLPVYSESMTPIGMKVAYSYLYGDAVKLPAAIKGN